MRSISDTISSGGFSSATRILQQLRKRLVEVFARAFILPRESIPCARHRPSLRRRWFWMRPFQTRTIRPRDRRRWGQATPSSAHRSLKWLCDALRSFSSAARHLAMKSCGVMFGYCHQFDTRTITICALFRLPAQPNERATRHRPTTPGHLTLASSLANLTGRSVQQRKKLFLPMLVFDLDGTRCRNGRYHFVLHIPDWYCDALQTCDDFLII